MNTNIEVLWRLDELVEAARLLGATQAKKLFGEHTEGDRRFERAMRESIDKHRANVARAVEPLQAEIEALRTEAEQHFQQAMSNGAKARAAQAHANKLERMLSVYQKAVNKIDDLIEYSLPMPPETKAALYAILANLTAAIAEELTND